MSWPLCCRMTIWWRVYQLYSTLCSRQRANIEACRLHIVIAVSILESIVSVLWYVPAEPAQALPWIAPQWLSDQGCYASDWLWPGTTHLVDGRSQSPCDWSAMAPRLHSVDQLWSLRHSKSALLCQQESSKVQAPGLQQPILGKILKLLCSLLRAWTWLLLQWSWDQRNKLMAEPWPLMAIYYSYLLPPCWRWHDSCIKGVR